jgi:DNA-binding CsgD family transcriptional regulator
VQRETHASIPAAAGFILVDTERKLIYANPEAKRILTYPEASRRFKLAWTPLQKKIFPALAKQNSPSSSTSQVEFISGRRKYVSRAFPLTKPQDGRPAGAAIAVLLERGGSGSYAVAEVCERFHLTDRERVVVEFLIQGLTNKEIAGRMNISPNTVRAFVRMVMIKLGVSTRSGIVGIVFRAIHTPLPS